MLHLLRQSHRGRPTVVEIGTRGAGHETLPAERTDRRRAVQGHRGSVEIADHGSAVVRGQGERFLGAIRCGHTFHNFHLRVRHLGRVQRPKEEVVPVGEEEPDDGTGEGRGQVAAGGVSVTDGKTCIFLSRSDASRPRVAETVILTSHPPLVNEQCPICLEPFDRTPEKDESAECDIASVDSSEKRRNQKLKRVDSFGIPTIGSDDKPIKLLRCGHIFDLSCWQMWVDSGTGNPWICPVCRQDIGRPKRVPTASQRLNNAIGGGVGGGGGGNGDDAGRREESTNQEQQQSSLFARMMANTSGPSMLLRPVNNVVANYNSIQLGTQSSIVHPRFVNRLGLHPTLGLSSTVLMDGVTEDTPLFSRASTGEGSDDY